MLSGKYRLRHLLTLLPVLAAVLLEASIRFFSSADHSAVSFFGIHSQLLLEALPYFAGHYLAWQWSGWRRALCWGAVFIGYPLVGIVMSEVSAGYAQWHLLCEQAYIMIAGFSALWFLQFYQGDTKRHRHWAAYLLALDNIVIACALVWAFILAGILLYTPDPMHNQPLQARIDFGQVVSEAGTFLNYFWQTLFLALILIGVYFFNRYILIRKLLSREGPVTFIAGALCFLLVGAPALAAGTLWLPLNGVSHLTLTPAGDHNPFGLDNFRFLFIFLAVSTPIILAFERKDRDSALAQAEALKTRTELKYLQQQINPHFLFNTLNNLYALCLERSEKAPQLVLQLANLLRYTVYSGQENRVVLSQELNYLEDFLALQRIRNGADCTVEYSHPAQSPPLQIAPLLLINIVENAFKHGVEATSGQSRILIDYRVDGATFSFTCENSLPEVTSADNEGIGLTNLRRRLQLQYPGRHQLVSERRGSKWFASLNVELEPC